MAIVAYSGNHADGSPFGRLFDTEEAELFAGDFCPLPDGSSGTAKEDLYLARNGDWVKNRVTLPSVGNDSSDYVRISPDEARSWLKNNNHPEAVKQYFERSKGGRPPIGDRLITTAPARMHNQIAVLSEMYAEDMPETVRRLLREALAHREEIGAPGSRDADLRPY